MLAHHAPPPDTSPLTSRFQHRYKTPWLEYWAPVTEPFFEAQKRGHEILTSLLGLALSSAQGLHWALKICFMLTQQSVQNRAYGTLLSWAALGVLTLILTFRFAVFCSIGLTVACALCCGAMILGKIVRAAAHNLSGFLHWAQGQDLERTAERDQQELQQAWELLSHHQPPQALDSEAHQAQVLYEKLQQDKIALKSSIKSLTAKLPHLAEVSDQIRNLWEANLDQQTEALAAWATKNLQPRAFTSRDEWAQATASYAQYCLRQEHAQIAAKLCGQEPAPEVLLRDYLKHELLCLPLGNTSAQAQFQWLSDISSLLIEEAQQHHSVDPSSDDFQQCLWAIQDLLQGRPVPDDFRGAEPYFPKDYLKDWPTQPPSGAPAPVIYRQELLESDDQGAPHATNDPSREVVSPRSITGS